MKINDRNRRGRAAFTLIELMVVIAIIAVLVSLLAAAVMKILGKGPEVQRRSDISQMQASLGSAKAAFGLNEQFPSLLIIDESGNYIPPVGSNQATISLYQDSAEFLRKMFKMVNPSQLKGPGNAGLDWNGNGTIDPPTTLTGDQCLVFFLGGIIPANANPAGPTGFSTLTGNPTAVGGERYGPFFNFQPKRLMRGSNGFFSYLDPYYTDSTPPTGAPYIYFSSYKRPNGYNRYGVGADAPSGYTVQPYIKTTSPLTYWNEGSFQIISAGPDKQFGQGGLWGASNPASGFGADDMSNFAQNILGAGQ